jgi:uncharacterized protein (DUF2267 family)
MTGDRRRRAAAGPGGGWVDGLAHQARHDGAHARRVLVRRGRHLHGVWEGTRYRLLRHGPDPLVGDDVLADRVRSTLGTVQKRLDVPRAHVMVVNHVVSLHGEVGTIGEALTLAGAAGAVPGVLGVDCRLHVGLPAGHGRPSQDRLRRRAPSPALGYLLAVAARAGLGADHATKAVHAVLESFLGCLPGGERRRLLGCLPADVGRLAGGARRGLPRTGEPGELIARVAAVSGLDDMVRAERVTVAVLAALRETLPCSRATHIGRSLPPGLRPLWSMAGQTVRAAGWPLRRQVWTQVCRGEWQRRWVDVPGQHPAGVQAGCRGGSTSAQGTVP